MMTVGGFLALGSLALLKWIIDPSKGFLFLSVILVSAGTFVFLVKASEELQPAGVQRGVVGQVGESVHDFGANVRGIVRIRGELWSAMSGTEISGNQKVRVVRSEGLCVWVERFE
jgi:membrane-bound ClpP family serine protease